MKYIDELEKALLDQIEKLNDDSIGTDIEQAKIMIDKSRAMATLSKEVIAINNLKLDVVKELDKNGTTFQKYLGIPE